MKEDLPSDDFPATRTLKFTYLREREMIWSWFSTHLKIKSNLFQNLLVWGVAILWSLPRLWFRRKSIAKKDDSFQAKNVFHFFFQVSPLRVSAWFREVIKSLPFAKLLPHTQNSARILHLTSKVPHLYHNCFSFLLIHRK